MRIVNRAEFLKLPAETVFCRYSTLGDFGAIEIKTQWGGFLDDDFESQQLFEVDTEDSGEFAETMIKAEQGEPVKLHFATSSRDALFDDQQLYAVFEKDEIREMIGRLTEAWKAQP